MLFDALLFDFDGVLVDSVNIKEQAFGALYSEHGNAIVKRVVEHHRSNGGVSRFDKFRHYHREFLGIEILADEVENLNQKFSHLVTQSVINANEINGADNMLRVVQNKLPLHVISATPEAELEQIIIARKMRHYFKSVHGAPQKKVAHIIEIIKQHGYQKPIMIGDALPDYEAAMEAEVDFLGYVSHSTNNPFPSHVRIISDWRILPLLIEK